MATRTRSGNGNLENAIALLMQNQAQFLAHLTETRLAFARMEKDLDTIKVVVVRHETMLEKLAEAIREKIGFKN